MQEFTSLSSQICLKVVKLCLHRLLGSLQKPSFSVKPQHLYCCQHWTLSDLALSTDAVIPLWYHVVAMWITTKLLQEYNISLPVITSHSCPSHKTSQFLLSDEGLTKHNSPAGSWEHKQSTETLELDLCEWFYKQDSYSLEHNLLWSPDPVAR